MKFQAVGKLEINGKNWEYGYGNPGKNNDGLCDHGKRRITIAKNNRVRSFVDVLAHETIHARLPDVSEESVESTAVLISRAYDLFSEHDASLVGGRG